MGERDKDFFLSLIEIDKLPLSMDEKAEHKAEIFRIWKGEEYDRMHRAVSGLLELHKR